jgi:hypothetical protein
LICHDKARSSLLGRWFKSQKTAKSPNYSKTGEGKGKKKTPEVMPCVPSGPMEPVVEG